LNNKLIMITGANAGIGKVAALELAKQGHHIVMVCRSQERGASAQTEIKAASGNRQVDLLIADLSMQADIRQLAAEFRQKYERLDVLVNNAGAIFDKRQETADGLERTFALNHMGYFLLTDLLLEVLKASAPARIVNVSSDTHRRGSINFDDLQRKKRYFSFEVYAQSKLANVLFTYELARRLEGSGVTANALHPGFVNSNFGSTMSRIPALFSRLFSRLLGTSPEQGAETIIYLASSPEVQGVTGKYFVKKKVTRSSPESCDEAVAKRLWQVSEALLC
jgi:NAD(P)-dependent dehydrogenase (short-subunit alcohol dehydrogenase family)